MLLARIGAWDPDLIGDTVSIEEFANLYTLIENGFFWIDYEKLQNRASAFAQFFNSMFSVAKFNSYFGKDLLNKYYRIKEIRCRRYHPDTSESVPSADDWGSQPVYDSRLVFRALSEDSTSTTTGIEAVLFQFKPGFDTDLVSASTITLGQAPVDSDSDGMPDYRALYEIPWETVPKMQSFMVH